MLFYFLSVDRGDADGRRIIVPALVDLDVPVDPGTQLLSATPAGTTTKAPPDAAWASLAAQGLMAATQLVLAIRLFHLPAATFRPPSLDDLRHLRTILK